MVGEPLPHYQSHLPNSPLDWIGLDCVEVILSCYDLGHKIFVLLSVSFDLCTSATGAS